MSYRDLTRTEIKLPSGAFTSIRKLRVDDYLDAKGIPVLPINGEGQKARSEEESFKQGIMFSRRILACCPDSIRFEGQTLRLVDKPSADCRPGELAIEDLTPDDAECIVAEVAKLSGLTAKAAEAVAPFPAQSSTADPGTSPG